MKSKMSKRYKKLSDSIKEKKNLKGNSIFVLIYEIN